MKLKPEILSNYCIAQFDPDFDYAQSDNSYCDRQVELSRSLKKVTYKFLFIFALLLIAATGNAQQIKATARLDSTNILIGDQIKLFLEIDYPKNAIVEYPQLPRSEERRVG